MLTVAAGESRGNQLLSERGYIEELIESMCGFEALPVIFKRICLAVLLCILTSGEINL